MFLVSLSLLQASTEAASSLVGTVSSRQLWNNLALWSLVPISLRTNIMPRSSELSAASDLDQNVAATEGRIGRLTLVASEHATAGRSGHARCARMLIALLQDELDNLNASRRAARSA
jgi:hypothetical protein